MALTKRQQKRSYAGFIGANGGEAPAAPTNDTAPAITGTAQVGQTLTVTPGAWSGVGEPDLTYQWNADGSAIDGATGLTYVPTAEDIGAVLTVTETARNWKGTASETSAATAAVIAED